MMRADHPSNTKTGRLCLYYKEHLRIIWRDDISNLKECLVTEITVKNERCLLRCSYRSSSHNREQFQSLRDSLDILMNNINSLNSLTADFDRKCSRWYLLILVTILEGTLHRLRVIVKLLTSQHNLQTIHLFELTFILIHILA